MKNLKNYSTSDLQECGFYFELLPQIIGSMKVEMPRLLLDLYQKDKELIIAELKKRNAPLTFIIPKEEVEKKVEDLGTKVYFTMPLKPIERVIETIDLLGLISLGKIDNIQKDQKTISIDGHIELCTTTPETFNKIISLYRKSFF